jgi:hypothetical protein
LTARTGERSALNVRLPRAKKDEHFGKLGVDKQGTDCYNSSIS